METQGSYKNINARGAILVISRHTAAGLVKLLNLKCRGRHVGEVWKSDCIQG